MSQVLSGAFFQPNVQHSGIHLRLFTVSAARFDEMKRKLWNGTFLVKCVFVLIAFGENEDFGLTGLNPDKLKNIIILSGIVGLAGHLIGVIPPEQTRYGLMAHQVIRHCAQREPILA